MDRPLIGLTTYGRDEEGRFSLPAPYVDAVHRAGAAVVLLPPVEIGGESGVEIGVESGVDRLFGTLDGIILTGGGDVDPVHYGGGEHEMLYMIDMERDQFELALVKRVLDSKLPMLGICRGTQLINVALGGSLHSHLPDVVGEDVLHRLPPREPTPHEVKVDAKSKLAEVLKVAEFSAASWHHQGIDRVASGMRVVATAPDGVIEGLELRDHPWCHCVQWHPELTAAEDSVQQRLFDWLVAVAAERRKD